MNALTAPGNTAGSGGVGRGTFDSDNWSLT